MASQIRGFLAKPLTLDESMEFVELGVRQREKRFIHKLKRSVYGNPASPYRTLLEMAGCELRDIESLVTREGIEGSLNSLARAGVFMTFDEFKCRTPVIRGSRTFQPKPEDFDDPNMRAESQGMTGGTTGNPVRTRWSFAQTAQMAPHWCVFFAANDCLGVPLLFWRPGHAGVSGSHLACAKFGQRTEGWFVSQEMTNPVDRLYANCVRWVGQRFAGFPRPTNVPYHGADPVVDKVVDLLSRSKAVCLNTVPSAAVRLSRAAEKRGVDLTGLICMLGAEPLTDARRMAIEACGASAVPLYGSNEATWVGGQCSSPRYADEVHVLRGSYAVIPGQSPDDPAGDGASPLLFTSLAPITPKILLNTDIGDRGVLGERRCQCLYDQLGCHQTIHHIRSADKITGFGVTFWVSDVHDVLETAIPRRLGGAPGDYQLVEYDSAEGLPVYSLVAHPRLATISEQGLIDLFLAELAQRKPYYGFMTSIWAREKVLHVRRQAPIATARGKILPFHRLSDARRLESGS
jgi:hypothetical protein